MGVFLFGCTAACPDSEWPAPAPPRTTVRVGPISFDCEAAADRTSDWWLALPEVDFVVRGQMRFASEQSHPRYVPAGQVALTGHLRMVYLRTFVDPATPDQLTVEVRDHTGEDREILGRLPFTREPLPFEVRTVGRRATMKIAGFRAEFDVRVRDIHLFCNAGNVVFEDVVLTR